jgi:asparagine synthase (glutamine-hydrolysing)
LNRKITIADIYKKNISPIYEDFINQHSPLDFSAWMMFCDARFRLPELMLPRLDKLCMASSVEGRVPFLDHRLFNRFISDSESERDGNIKLGKDIVRKVYAKYFCHFESQAKKIGFKAPVSEWKSGEAGNFSRKIVDIFLQRTDIFDEKYMMEIMHSENDRLYYSLLSFVIWYNQFIDEVLPEFELKYDDR